MCIVITSQGIPEYNCFINVNKTIKNFEIVEGGEAKVNTDGTPKQLFVKIVSDQLL